jgi:hypothetical protein
MHAPHVDHPCEEFLDRRPCFAVAQIPCGQQQAPQARLGRVRRICTHQIQGVASTGPAHAVPGFSKCAALLGGASTIRDDGGRAGATTIALVSAGPSSSTAEAVSRCGQGDANARTRNNREGAMPLASNAADRASRVNDGTARRMPEASIDFRSDGARLWNRPYTLWRADRPAICRRNAVLH